MKYLFDTRDYVLLDSRVLSAVIALSNSEMFHYHMLSLSLDTKNKTEKREKTLNSDENRRKAQ